MCLFTCCKSIIQVIKKCCCCCIPNVNQKEMQNDNKIPENPAVVNPKQENMVIEPINMQIHANAEISKNIEKPVIIMERLSQDTPKISLHDSIEISDKEYSKSE